jgi:hypothetical protein
MTNRHPAERIERKQTAAAEQITGQFHCSSSNHFATGTPVIIRGRKVCQACAAQRKKVLKEKIRGKH